MNEASEATPRRGLRVRWWWWPILLLVILLLFAIAMRATGWNQYQRVQGELQARGLPIDPVTLVAAAPAVDRDRQERLWTAMQAICGRSSPTTAVPWSDWRCGVPFGSLQEGTSLLKPRTEVEKNLADGASLVAAVEQILDQGPVQISAFGWIERDPAKLRTINLAQAAATRIPSLMASRACVNWWGTQAVFAEDPRPALRRLDQWHENMRKPGTLIDAMIAIACSTIRDQTYLWLASRGRLPADDLDRWSREVPEQRRWCADGFTSERCLFWEPASRMEIKFMLSPSTFGLSMHRASQIVAVLGWWPMQYHESANCAAALAGVEEHLRDRPAVPAYNPPFGYQGIISSIAMPNLMESGVAATEAAYAHRLRRIAGIIATRHRADAMLPAGGSELANWLPPAALAAHSANLPAITFERLAPSRFRIGLDPKGPQPPDMPSGRIQTDIGKPPNAKSVSDLKWSLEIDLDAILVPPPPKPPKPPKKL